MHILDLFETAQGFLDGEPIANEATAALVNKLINDALEARRDAEAMRKDEAKPFDDGKKAVQARWTPLTDEKTGKCAMIVSTARKALQPWLLKLEAEQEAIREKARAAAETARLAALEAERAAQAQDDLAATEQAAHARKEADIAAAMASRAEKAKPLAKGGARASGLRSVWRAEIVDRRELLKHYMQARPDDLTAWLQSEADSDVRTGARSLPGCNIIEERVAI